MGREAPDNWQPMGHSPESTHEVETTGYPPKYRHRNKVVDGTAQNDDDNPWRPGLPRE